MVSSAMRGIVTGRRDTDEPSCRVGHHQPHHQRLARLELPVAAGARIRRRLGELDLVVVDHRCWEPFADVRREHERFDEVDAGALDGAGRAPAAAISAGTASSPATSSPNRRRSRSGRRAAAAARSRARRARPLPHARRRRAASRRSRRIPRCAAAWPPSRAPPGGRGCRGSSRAHQLRRGARRRPFDPSASLTRGSRATCLARRAAPCDHSDPLSSISPAAAIPVIIEIWAFASSIGSGPR